MLDGVHDPQGKGRFWGSNPTQNMQLPVLCGRMANTNEERLRLLTNYFTSQQQKHRLTRSVCVYAVDSQGRIIRGHEKKTLL